jgi:hypothetical protein
MDINTHKQEFISDMLSFKNDLVNNFNRVDVEIYRKEYKGRYSPERFKEYFIEKAAIHTVFKYILIRLIEESMQRVNPKLNEVGLKNWHEMSKNFRKDYDLLFDIAINDVRRERDLSVLFEETIYDQKLFADKITNPLRSHIPKLSKYEFSSLDANLTLTLVDELYPSERREELQKIQQPSPIIDFLLQQVGLA